MSMTVTNLPAKDWEEDILGKVLEKICKALGKNNLSPEVRCRAKLPRTELQTLCHIACFHLLYSLIFFPLLIRLTEIFLRIISYLNCTKNIKKRWFYPLLIKRFRRGRSRSWVSVEMTMGCPPEDPDKNLRDSRLWLIRDVLSIIKFS